MTVLASRERLRGIDVGDGSFVPTSLLEVGASGISSLSMPRELCHYDMSKLALSFSYWSGCDLRDCDLRESVLTSSSFVGSTLRDVDFSFAHLEHSSFCQSRLENVRFFGANMRHSSFTGCEFGEEVDFHGSYWSATWLSKSQRPSLLLRNLIKNGQYEWRDGWLVRPFSTLVGRVTSTGCDIEFARILYEANPRRTVEEMMTLFRGLGDKGLI